MKKDDNNILGNSFNSKNKIEGTPILKLAMVKRLKVNKNLPKKFVKNSSKNLSKKNSSKNSSKKNSSIKFVKKIRQKKIHQKIRQTK